MRCFCAHVKGRRRISLALSLVIGFILIAGAALAVPVPVLAISAGGIKSTIASIIISLLLQTGVAPTNQAWLNQLNNAYGVESSIGTIEDCITNGLLTETANGLVDTGLSNAISSIPEYTDLGLDDLFTTVATDTGVSVASGAANIANSAINVGTLGTIGAFAGAASIGVGLGVLINHVRQKLADYIRYNISGDTTNTDYVNNVPSNFTKQYYLDRIYGNSHIYRAIKFTPSNVYTVGYLDGGTYSLSAWLFQGTSIYDGVNYSINTDRLVSNAPPGIVTNEYPNNRASNWQIANNPNNRIGANNFDKLFNTKTEYDNWLSALENGQVQPPNNNPISNDYVGPLGNQYPAVDPNTGETIFPGIRPMVPDGYDMQPVDMEEYQNYVDGANQNTEDGLTGEDTQGAEFDEFVDQYMVPYEEILPDPEPDEPLIPEYPDEIPEYPDRPVNPEQPIIPDKPEIPGEDIETNLDLTATPDLRGIFPFCIPWDIYNLVLIFDTGENRQAPHITFTFPGTDWVIDVDLSDFDSVAGLLRLLELILFIVGLMVATRSLIGAGG